MPGGPSGLRSRLYTPSVAFALTTQARLLLSPANGGAMSRHGRLRLTLRTARSLPPEGLSTLGFDAGRFPRRRQPATGPPGSYPDRTPTGRRRRAYVGSGHLNQPPPTLGTRCSHGEGGV